jgi:hypothetical protein
MANASVRDSAWASVWASVGDSVWASVWDSVYGQHEAHWLAFYDYFGEVLDLKEQTAKLKGLDMVAKSANWFLPHKKICWVSERHNIVRLNARNRLHCETGMALAYPDGWGIYALNGVRMKPEYVLTSAQEIKPEMIMKETNIDVRRELIRKVGIDKMVGYGKEVSTQGDYKLIDMSKLFERIRYAPFLLMKNPSLDNTFHLEGVSPECRTVQEAINWRAGNREIEWSPALLS